MANGGHEYPALMREGRFQLRQDIRGFVVGAVSGIRCSDVEIQLKPGDRLFVYTDGVPEAMNSHREQFGLERMMKALNAEPEASPENLLINVRRAVDDFVKDEQQFDDLTMLCLDYKGP